MIPKHQREAISRHEERLNELLHAAVEELESISGYGLGESDWNEADGTITFLFQDVSLLKRFRQRCVQPQDLLNPGIMLINPHPKGHRVLLHGRNGKFKSVTFGRIRFISSVSHV